MVPFNKTQLNKNILKVKSEVNKYCLSLNHKKEEIKNVQYVMILLKKITI